MPDLPVPTAARLARPRWLDPRFAAGLLLVLVSVVAGSRVVAAADDTVAVWAAGRGLAVGAPLDRSALVVAHVQLDGREPGYLAASVDPAGLVATRPLAAGELLAAAGVGKAQPRTVRAVSVDAEPSSASGLREGSVVDVYVVPDDAQRSSDQASTAGSDGLAPVLRSVPVRRVGDDGGRFSSSGTVSVTLDVPEGEVGGFLAAVPTGSVQLVEVPAGGAS
ncbi:hypothetical protein CLV35_2829 [Motilibacter peucedani]|uniref:SAF domain-containing protein n=1 Tax=Motilibacter peucedani TaxID=598650 RepID=A0A420XMU0_9ACTN|nr:hypothetical protein [Motilibacter peucedani]RKS72582.1 hypothetical protein CLV35_2829 [Motilibacter peucedani]